MSERGGGGSSKQGAQAGVRLRGTPGACLFCWWAAGGADAGTKTGTAPLPRSTRSVSASSPFPVAAASGVGEALASSAAAVDAQGSAEDQESPEARQPGRSSPDVVWCAHCLTTVPSFGGVLFRWLWAAVLAMRDPRKMSWSQLKGWAMCLRKGLFCGGSFSFGGVVVFRLNRLGCGW